MIEKCNKIYSLFCTDIIMSDNARLSALQGFDVEDAGVVGGVEDLNYYWASHRMLMGSVSENKVLKFTNPSSNESWYISRFFIAHKGKGQDSSAISLPEIEAFAYKGSLIVISLETLQRYKAFFEREGTRRISIVYQIGFLSTPHNTVSNRRIVFDGIKLPYKVCL